LLNNIAPDRPIFSKMWGLFVRFGLILLCFLVNLNAFSQNRDFTEIFVGDGLGLDVQLAVIHDNIENKLEMIRTEFQSIDTEKKSAIEDLKSEFRRWLGETHGLLSDLRRSRRKDAVSKQSSAKSMKSGEQGEIKQIEQLMVRLNMLIMRAYSTRSTLVKTGAIAKEIPLLEKEYVKLYFFSEFEKRTR